MKLKKMFLKQKWKNFLTIGLSLTEELLQTHDSRYKVNYTEMNDKTEDAG